MKGKSSLIPPGRHWQEDAYSTIFRAAIRMQELDTARRVVGLWCASAGNDADYSIVDAWLEPGHRDDAIAYAFSVKDKADRVFTLLGLAGSLLDEAGAPLP